MPADQPPAAATEDRAHPRCNRCGNTEAGDCWGVCLCESCYTAASSCCAETDADYAAREGSRSSASVEGVPKAKEPDRSGS